MSLGGKTERDLPPFTKELSTKTLPNNDLLKNFSNDHDDAVTPAKTLLRPEIRSEIWDQFPRNRDGTNSGSNSTFSNHQLCRTLPTHHSLLETVESISKTLIDPSSESYGRNSTTQYAIVEASFNPDGCNWNVNVNYKRFVIRKCQDGDSSPKEEKSIIDKIYEGTLSITLQCFEIKSFYDESSDSEEEGEEEEEEDSFEEDEFGDCHTLAIDVIATFDIDVDVLERNQVENNKEILISVNKVFENICLDISRSLAKLGIPNFSEARKDKSFKDVFKLHKKINSGSYGSVCLGTHRASKKRVAAKIIRRNQLSPEDDTAVFNEVDILASLKHPYICSLFDFFIQDDCYLIAMEYCSGGDLFERLSKMNAFDESHARDLCKKLLEAITYCHDNDIVHCDLKPKNLLLEDDYTTIKLADFGFATRIYSSNSLTKQCGTLYFVAPEILKGNTYDEKADMWSVGVTIYSLLSGQLPFNGINPHQLKSAIISGEFTFDEEAWHGISRGAKYLVNNLLVTDPQYRWSARQALENSTWLRRDDSKILRRTSLVRTSQRLKIFNARLAFKSAILATSFIVRMRILANQSRMEQSSVASRDSLLDSVCENSCDEEHSKT